MTAEEYIVEKVKKLEKEAVKITKTLLEVEKARGDLLDDLKFVCGLVNRVEFEGKNQFELSVWDLYDRDNYNRLNRVMATFGSEKQCEEE